MDGDCGAKSVSDLLQIPGNDKCADCGQNGKNDFTFLTLSLGDRTECCVGVASDVRLILEYRNYCHVRYEHVYSPER